MTVVPTELVLSSSPAIYRREARLARTGDGGVALHAIAWDVALGVERHERRVLGLSRESLTLGEAEVIDEGRALRSLAWAPTPFVREDARVDGEARARFAGREESVVVRREGARAEVVLVRDGRAVRVFATRGTVEAPALAPVEDGTWIAFHHNVREDTGEQDLAKWIALRFVDARGGVFEPAAEMCGRDRDATGEEQGFEFPTIVVARDGALSLFGRGSHAFHRQDVNAAGFTPRVALDDGVWGCRGRRVAAIALDERRVVTARRDKRGLVISVWSGASGGRPALRPAEVEVASRAHRDVPRRPRGTDLAARWGRETLFGDIHQHSAHSDGCGTAHEPYVRARHVYGDDFCALSDHESFLGKRIGPGEWRYLRDVADAHAEAGTFVTLHAYEWTGRMHPGPGHKVVYPLTDVHGLVSRDVEPSGRGLVQALREGAARGERAICVPHHVGWTGADEEAHDPEVQPIWEICSCHGCYLHAGHALGQRGELRDQMIESVLRRGRRFGFIACSDGHGLLHHHGVGRKRDPFRTGLTAVQARARTREAVLEALVERRCYATSGAPIWLDVDAGGAPMGSVHVGTVEVVVRAVGQAPVRELAWVGPEGVVASAAGRGCEAELVVTTSSPWGYARVTQEDGELAWSSPVFVE